MQRLSINGGSTFAAKTVLKRHVSSSLIPCSSNFVLKSRQCVSACLGCTCSKCASSSRGSDSRRFKSTRPAIADEADDAYHHGESPKVTMYPLHDWKTQRPSVTPRRTRTATPPSLHASVALDLPSPETALHQEQEPAIAPRTQPTQMAYSGTTSIPITSTLHIVTPQEDTPRGIWPAFRMMDEDGCFRDVASEGEREQRIAVPPLANFQADLTAPTTAAPTFLTHLKEAHPKYAEILDQSRLFRVAKDARTSFTPSLDDNQDEETQLPLFMRAHRHMLRVREMDKILQNAQRQGRISFYMTCTGEEAIHMGSASALQLQDHVLAQYREQGVLMWRGFTLEQFTNQCFSNDRDLGKARQMPVHYGSRALNYHTVSSPLGTQIPQAVGAAYRLKMTQKDSVAMCYFGEGCSSTTDFHSGLNFAATLKAPVIFFCRNNGYAISTPVQDQYAGDGVVARGPGYGIASIRVDGNDIFAVHAAVKAAREYVLANDGAPVLIEAMTYRLGHHSTSDDSSRYRDSKEVNRCLEDHDPVTRLENFLVQHRWLTSEKIGQIKEIERKAVLRAIEKAERRQKPHLESLFTDVYHKLPPHLLEQQDQLLQHVEKYPEKYS
ncbi:hypothetical protein ACA910_009947 [Epithemia clementina (nom. ined.)]